jgi:C1A family cysteine protease
MAKAKRSTKSKTTAKTGRPESQRICNLLPSLNTNTDWTYESALTAGLAEPVALPASVDLRAAWWDVGDQKNTGACVGWASTDGVARYMFVKANRLTQNARLSPRFTWMASKETDQATSRPETMLDCAGTYLKTACDVLKNYGASPEELVPFTISAAMYTGDENAFFATTATRKIAAYFNLARDLANWKSWLANHGPILVGLNVDQTWDKATDTGGKLDTFKPATVRGGHAVCVVGDRADGRFIIRNSWGTAWGDKGFAYASPAYINAGFFPESYGMTL